MTRQLTARQHLRITIGCRPILGLLIRGRPLPERPQPVHHLVKNPRTNLYWRNPWPHYQIATPEWGKVEQAYRFHCPDYARSIMSEQGVTGEVIVVQTPR